jgi:hypothetical protein
LRQRIALVKQVALPPSAYMMEKYQINNRLALPFLYGYRSVKGVFKWFKWVIAYAPAIFGLWRSLASIMTIMTNCKVPPRRHIRR